MSGVGHHDRCRLRKLSATETGHAMASDGSGHARASRTPPKRVSACAYPERLRVPENKGDCGGEILRRHCSASRAVLQHEGVEASLADLGGVGKAFMHGADINRTAARRDDGEGCAWLPPVEEEPGMRLRWQFMLLTVGIDIKEDRPALSRIVDHPVQRTDRRRRIDMSMVGKKRTKRAQLHRLVVTAVIPRQNQAREPYEGRMTQEITDRIFGPQSRERVIDARRRLFRIGPSRGLGKSTHGGGQQDRQSETLASRCEEAAPAEGRRGAFLHRSFP